MSARDDARRQWEVLSAILASADASAPASGLGVNVSLQRETVRWLGDVARRMLDADSLPDGNARHLTIVEASGLTGNSTGRTASGLTVTWALRALQTTVERDQAEARAIDPVEWIAARMEWDTTGAVARDSLKKRIRRNLGPDLRVEFDALLAAWPK